MLSGVLVVLEADVYVRMPYRFGIADILSLDGVHVGKMYRHLMSARSCGRDRVSVDRTLREVDLR